jgi:hypothetical protein
MVLFLLPPDCIVPCGIEPEKKEDCLHFKETVQWYQVLGSVFKVKPAGNWFSFGEVDLTP